MANQNSMCDTVLLPETKIAAAAELTVFDAQGNKIQFGALFELEKTIVVFISEYFVLGVRGSC